MDPNPSPTSDESQLKPKLRLNADGVTSDAFGYYEQESVTKVLGYSPRLHEVFVHVSIRIYPQGIRKPD